MEPVYHIPVFLKESVDLLVARPEGVYVDVTFGGGGHTREILSRLTTGRLIAFDKDQAALGNVPDDDRFSLIGEDFKFIETLLKVKGITQVDGILADLGVSSHQFDTAERGFSFRFDAPLDMRMSMDQPRTAADLLNDADERLLVEIFRDYGEIPNARRLMQAVVQARALGRIETTRELEKIAGACAPAKRRSKYLAQVFQALRIAVNREIEALQALLEASLGLIKPGGRLVVISYHSLEDRLVKRFMKSGNLAGIVEKDFFGNPLVPWKAITRKALQPTESEVDRNPRARSARLRAAERIEERK